jgi:hypothetical protein
MRSLLVVALLTAACGGAPPVPPPPHQWFPDIDVDNGVAKSTHAGPFVYSGRLRAGISDIADFRFYNIAATVETYAFQRYLFGAQVGYISIVSGLGANIGANITDDGHFGLNASGCYSLFCAQYQAIFDPARTDHEFSAFVRIPVGAIWYALTRKPQTVRIRIPATAPASRP